MLYVKGEIIGSVRELCFTKSSNNQNLMQVVIYVQEVWYSPKNKKNDKVFIYIQCFWLQFRNQVLFLFFQIPVIFVIATAMCFICMLIPDGKTMLEIKSLNIMSMIIVNSRVLSTRKRISYIYLYYNLLLKGLWKGVYFT